MRGGYVSETQDSDEEGDVRYRHRVRARRSRVELQEGQLFRRTLCHEILVMERACWQRLTEEPAEESVPLHTPCQTSCDILDSKEDNDARFDAEPDARVG